MADKPSSGARTTAAPKAGPAPRSGFRVARGVVKTGAIVVGLPLTVLSLMSLVGLATGNFWARIVPAVVVALVGPLLLIGKLAPEDVSKRVRGMPTDVLAVCWLGLAFLFVGVAAPATGPLLVTEADRYAAGGSVTMARAVYWLGGVTPVASAEAAEGATTEDVEPEPGRGDAGAPPPVDGGAGEAAGEADARPAVEADADRR